MRVNNYLSVCMFQLNLELACDSQREYLIETDEVLNQMEKAFQIIDKLHGSLTCPSFG